MVIGPEGEAQAAWRMAAGVSDNATMAAVVSARVLLALVIAAGIPARGAAAQDASAAAVSLKTAVGIPGTEARVPIYLEAGDSAIRSVTFAVSFPGPLLSFIRLELASRSLQPVAERSTAAIEGKEGLLTVEMSNDEKPLPAGPLGWLVFRLSAKVDTEALTLALQRPSARIVPGDRVYLTRATCKGRTIDSSALFQPVGTARSSGRGTARFRFCGEEDR